MEHHNIIIMSSPDNSLSALAAMMIATMSAMASGKEPSGDARHTYRERQVTFCQIGNHVGSRATWTTIYQHDTKCQCLIERENPCAYPYQQRHDGELCQTTYNNILRTMSDVILKCTCSSPQRPARTLFRHSDGWPSTCQA